MIFATLLLSTLTPHSANGSEPETAENTFVTYDIASIALRKPEEPSSTWLLPYFRPHSTVKDWSDPEDAMVRTTDELHAMISRIFDDEFEFEGRSIELLGEDTLIVGGPSGLHARVSQALNFLDAVLNAEVELTIDFFSSAEPGSFTALSGSSELSEEQAQSLIGKLAEKYAHKQLVLRVRADREMVVDWTRELSVLRDYDVEVAQGLSIHDPVVDTASFGTRLGLTATPGNSGLSLALTLQRGDLQGDLTEFDLGLAREYATDDGVHTTPSPSLMQGVELTNRSLALNTVLRTDHALVLASQFNVRGGSSQDIVVIRKTGGGLSIAAESKIGQYGLTLALLHREALAPPKLVPGGTLLRRAGFTSGMRTDWRTSKSRPLVPTLTTTLEDQGSDKAMGFLTSDFEVLSALDYGPWSVLAVSPTNQGEGASTEFVAGLKSFHSVSGDEQLVQVSVSVRSGGDQDVSLARFSMPMRLGATSACVLGVESLAITDYDVEIASHSAAPDPVVASVFDGLALSLTPRRTPSGNLKLDIRGGVHLERDRRQTELGGSIIHWLDQRAYDQLIVNQELNFGAGSKPRTIQLGTVGMGSTGGLRLVVTVED